MTKIDYSKLLGFDMVSDEAKVGIDFNDPTIGARLGAKVGKVTTVTKDLQPMKLPDPEAAGPVMVGLGGRKITA
jgi:hypothetical protein